jgi:hypothetical protein
MSDVRRSCFLFAALVSIAALLMAMFWGIPVPKAGRVEGVRSLVAGGYSPKDRLLVPTKVMTNTDEVSRFMERLSVAPQRLVLPTLGGLRGPVVLLDREGDPITAAFYQSEHKALVLYNVRRAEGAFKIMSEKVVLGGSLQRVFSYNFFDDASGKWQTLDIQRTNSQAAH